MIEEKKAKSDYTSSIDEVIRREKEHLGIGPEKPVWGLAISGGGIRSASFGLGVIQALVRYDQLKKIDYMSTVSGGGYLGSALTWALKQGGKNVGTSPDNFPLGKRVGLDPKDVDHQDSHMLENNKLLDFIRQHGSYLTPSPSLDLFSFSAVVMRSIMVSLLIYFSIITVLMTAFTWVIYAISNRFLGQILASLNRILGANLVTSSNGVLLSFGILIICVIVLMGFYFSLGTFFRGSKIAKKRYARFIKGQMRQGSLLKLSMTCLVLGSLPFVTHALNDALRAALAAGSSTFFGAAVGIWQYVKARSNDNTSGVKSDLLIYAGAFALFYGLLLFSYITAKFLFLEVDNSFTFYPAMMFFVLVAATLIFGCMVNINLLGPHYLWRSRLMEAFMPNRNAVDTNNWGPATEADGALMEDMCDEHNPRPYHIVNTNVILSNSEQIDYRGRGGDNFIISPLFCGSDATGWRTTKTFQNKKTRGITLASAMATSAAALNPSAGVSGEGVTRNTVVSILLSMLNLRLGYWTSNPKYKENEGSPNFIVPGLTSEILRLGMNENSRKLLLSDGGHYENIAIYELIRRKLSVIIVSDGGADPNCNLDDLANAIEKVRVDFGAKIEFKNGYETSQLLPGTCGDSFFHKKYELSKRGFAIANITYSDLSKGVMVYLKLAMIEGFPTDIYSYKGVYPSFPHQSTSDQFFDEKQFEAYRELGYYGTKEMMKSQEAQFNIFA